MTDAAEIAARLTEIDAERLADLVAAYDTLVTMTFFGDQDLYGVAPIDCGGTNGSDHSYRLTKLARMGLADHRKRGYDWGKAPTRGYRGSKIYRPTALGRAVLTAYHEEMK